jgi:hypothetical protein
MKRGSAPDKSLLRFHSRAMSCVPQTSLISGGTREFAVGKSHLNTALRTKTDFCDAMHAPNEQLTAHFEYRPEFFSPLTETVPVSNLNYAASITIAQTAPIAKSRGNRRVSRRSPVTPKNSADEILRSLYTFNR